MKLKMLVFLLVLVLFIGVLSTAEAQNGTCASISSQLAIGGQGVVLPGDPNIIRNRPSRTGTRLGSIPAGGVFDVLDGPRCGNSITWWYVDYAGKEGWTAEGVGTVAYIEAYDMATATPRPTFSLRPRSTPGRVATVVPQTGAGTISSAQASVAIETLFSDANADVSAYLCPAFIEEFRDPERILVKTTANCKASGSGMVCTITSGGYFPGSMSMTYTFHYEDGKLCLDE